MAMKWVKVCDVCGVVLGIHDRQVTDSGKDYCHRCYQYQHSTQGLSMYALGKSGIDQDIKIIL